MSGEVTRLLLKWSGGEKEALDQLIPLLYGELRHLSKAFLRREQPGHTLQTTELVHEAFLRMVDQDRVNWQDRAHFFAIAAQLMRRILVDHARRRLAAKRGRNPLLVTLDHAMGIPRPREVDLVSLNEALDRLALKDARQSRIVELRFFGGLTVDEAATVLKVSNATIKRDWAVAKAWLFRELETAS